MPMLTRVAMTRLQYASLMSVPFYPPATPTNCSISSDSMTCDPIKLDWWMNVGSRLVSSYFDMVRPLPQPPINLSHCLDTADEGATSAILTDFFNTTLHLSITESTLRHHAHHLSHQPRPPLATLLPTVEHVYGSRETLMNLLALHSSHCITQPLELSWCALSVSERDDIERASRSVDTSSHAEVALNDFFKGKSDFRGVMLDDDESDSCSEWESDEGVAVEEENDDLFEQNDEMERVVRSLYADSQPTIDDLSTSLSIQEGRQGPTMTLYKSLNIDQSTFS